jgi:hypothetical protein
MGVVQALQARIRMAVMHLAHRTMNFPVMLQCSKNTAFGLIGQKY